jgi:hypothetical protein
MTKLKQKTTEVLDRILGKLVSRKLTVFIVASYGMFDKSIESSDWTIIAGIYIGSETVISAIKEFYKIKNGDNNIN